MTNTITTTPPRIAATISDDGGVTLQIGTRVETSTHDTIPAAREAIVERIALIAARRGQPLSAIMQDPNGVWPVIIHGNGRVEENTAKAAPEPEPEDVADVPASKDEVTAAPVAYDPPQPAPASDVHSPAVQARPESSPAPEALSLPPSTRRSFLATETRQEPATDGFRGVLARMGIRVQPSAAERARRADEQAISQHWAGPRTIAVVNGKGGASKTPTVVLLSAVFARYGGAGVLAWATNQTRGTLGWRTEQGAHESTLLELLPEVPQLLSPTAQSADLARFVHHQTRDKFDVLRSQPMALAENQRIDAADVDDIHSIARKYYRLIFIDSGNDESDPLWQRMIDHTDQLVVATTTRDDHAEAGALLLEALGKRDERSADLAQRAVVVVNQANGKAPKRDALDVASGYSSLARQAVTIPHDPGMVDGILRYSALNRDTQRAWVAAAAAVARGL